MTEYPFAQIDAFAERPFEGNQACVMLMDAFLPDATLQAIAGENNVAETAFIVPAGEGRWTLRWFTPGREVPLCGHATLATAHWLFQHHGFTGENIVFETLQSGPLTVTRAGDGRLAMDFPATEVRETAITPEIVDALGARPAAMFSGGYLAALFETASDVTALAPDFGKLARLTGADLQSGCIGCLAPGGKDGADVTSRFFAPGAKIDEDPATGSWHCMVAPLMAPRLGKSDLRCFQAYPGRGAWIGAEVAGTRVMLRGHAVTVIEGVFRTQ
ncbi:MAG: PhzF family phenazine biosynthesis protein [Pseudomonadota bacterium]